MHAWKIVFVATVLSAALTVMIVHHFGRIGDKALAAHNSRQPYSVVTDPITPSDNSRIGRTPDSGHGWGPVRTVDW